MFFCFYSTLGNNQRCFSLTFHAEDGGALGLPEGVLCSDGVLPHVFGAHAENQHGANAAGVGDVIVSISVEADVIAVPRDARFGVSLHRAAHVALVALGCSVKLQRDDEGRSASQVAVLSGRYAHHTFFCKE